MSTIRKILVPTDFFPHAQEAFRVAHDLARAIGAGIVVFHVSRPPAVVSDGHSALSTPADVEGKDVWERLRKIQPTDPAVHVEHEVIVADRPDASHILRILHERGCDLIVIGTHGRTGLRHLLFGSVTEDVVRRAQCPVMVVKAPVHDAEATARPFVGETTSRSPTTAAAVPTAPRAVGR
jgi:nucleotide-binding universal stress UspA family protein